MGRRLNFVIIACLILTFINNSTFGKNVLQLSPLINGGTMIPDASFLGTHESERIGYALGGGGDVNGDGYSDFLIGTFHNYVYGRDTGAAYLILGGAPETWQMQSQVSEIAARFQGEDKNRAVGYSVANNGDLNGDGFDDLLIGAPAGNPQTRLPGKVYFINGKAEPDWGYDFILSLSANGAVNGEENFSRFGTSVAYVGDINNDGFDDFIVGAPDYDSPYSNSGKVYFFRGKAGAWTLDDEAQYEAHATFTCEKDEANLGFSVAGVGDVNGDAIPDFLMGAPGMNRTFLIYGRSETDWHDNFYVDKSADVIFKGENYSGEMNGYCVAGAGDVNGDGLNDMIISAIHSRANGRYSGKTYIVFGRQGGWAEQEVSLANADASFMGENSGDFSGWSVSSAGDVDGDGFSECLIGMFDEDDKKNVAGKGYLVQGRSEGWLQNQNLGTLPYFEDERVYTLCGFCVSGVGDVDGDRWGDFLVASPYSGVDSSGQVYLFRSERPQAKISGQVTYYQTQQPVTNARVILTGDFQRSDSTKEDGSFELNVYQQADYQLSLPDLSQVPQNESCVSAYDAALVARSVLKLETFSAQQNLAADVDLDGEVTLFDAAVILRADVGMEPLPETHAGQWSVPDSARTFVDVKEDVPNQNFTALVLGDVNASWGDEISRLAKSEQNTEKKIIEIHCTTESKIAVPVEIENFKNLIAFDLTVEFDSDVLNLEEVRKTNLIKDFTLSHHETKTGCLKIGSFSSNLLKKDGNIVELIFSIDAPLQKETLVSISGIRFNDETQKNREILVKPLSETPQVYTYQLLQNYPNPFNATTRIKYELSEKTLVDLSIFNEVGQKICIIVNNFQEAGQYQVNWNSMNAVGNPVPSGVYFLKLSTGSYSQVRKVVLIR